MEIGWEDISQSETDAPEKHGGKKNISISRIQLQGSQSTASKKNK